MKKNEEGFGGNQVKRRDRLFNVQQQHLDSCDIITLRQAQQQQQQLLHGFSSRNSCNPTATCRIALCPSVSFYFRSSVSLSTG